MKKAEMSNLPEQHRRYPGPRPFTYSDRHVFKGRDQEVSELIEHLRQNMYLLLYARSGIGKSSLIEAGLIPKLNELDNYISFKIVFGAYNKREPLPPLDAVVLHLGKALSQLTYLDKFLFKENSLWYHVKSLQAIYTEKSKIKNRQLGTDKQILLIFDQFEELFTYPPEDIVAFKRGLAEMLFTQIPDVFRRALLEKSESPDIHIDDIEMLHHPLNIRVLFSIRSDRMALLNHLTDCLPEILKNFYEIKPLSREQSKKAIVYPATSTHIFDSPVFEYDPFLLADILDFLSKDQEQYIESFQLQIICKYIEDLIIDSAGKAIVTKKDVPVLEDIFLSFYKKTINKTPEITWYKNQNTDAPDSIQVGKIRRSTEDLIEKGLIFRTGSEMGIRLNLYREQITQLYPEVDDAALWTLGRERILRETPDAAGRMRYELAHDTLIKPILQALDTREKQVREQADREERQRIEREETTRRGREIGESEKVEVEWDFILQSIRDNQAVLILGENALCDPKGIPLFTHFVESLDIIGRGLNYYKEEQLFWFRELMDRLRVAHEWRSFYEHNDWPIPLLEHIGSIPFPLILSFDPSDLIKRNLEKNSVPFRYAYYNRGEISTENFEEREPQRMVFNLFGSLSDDASMVITLDDAFNHLYGILGNNPVPPTIRNQLKKARVFVMYGINFQGMVNQPILWQILSNNQESVRLSLMNGVDLGKEELQAKALLNMEFLSIPPKEFFEQLQLRSMSGSINESYKSLYQQTKEIEELVIGNKIAQAINKLMDLVRLYGNENLSMSVTLLKNDFNHLSSEYLRNITDSSDAKRKQSVIVSEILRTVNTLKKAL